LTTATIQPQVLNAKITHRERELGAIINAYNEVTERLKQSHDQLRNEVVRLHTQLDEKNRELARRERLAALGEMAAGVAHEIRNPLGGIRLYASLLIKDLDDQPEAQRLAQKMSDGVTMLEGIVGGVMEFAGESQPDLEAVSLQRLVEEALGLAAPSITARCVEPRVSPIDVSVCVKADSNQILRALLNLLLNAVDAVDEGGCIEVWTQLDPSGANCEIHVADDGAGIAPELLNRIFHPFFTTKSSGTGLGLAVVHRIADAHDGSVRAKNRSGGGADFCLTLPLSTPSKLTPPKSTETKGVTESGGD